MALCPVLSQFIAWLNLDLGFETCLRTMAMTGTRCQGVAACKTFTKNLYMMVHHCHAIKIIQIYHTRLSSQTQLAMQLISQW